jgi:hypothetical protein
MVRATTNGPFTHNAGNLFFQLAGLILICRDRELASLYQWVLVYLWMRPCATRGSIQKR